MLNPDVQCGDDPVSALATLAPNLEARWSDPSAFGLGASRDGSDVRIEVHGELDLTRAAELETALTTARTSDAKCILLDLRGVVFLDCVGLGAILTAHRQLSGGRALLLLRGPRPVQRVFELAGVEESLFFLD